MGGQRDGCVVAARGPLPSQMQEARGERTLEKETMKTTAQVGKPAPDFEASAFVKGGFKNIKLSDYKGCWIVLCFYPGDFTFV